MYNPNCKCPHHIIAMIMGLLTWVSAVLFLWTAWKGVPVFGFGAGAYFDHVVIFALLGFGLTSSGMCKCCWKGMKGGLLGQGMSCVCRCGDCSGGKCDSRHGENHQHI